MFFLLLAILVSFQQPVDETSRDTKPEVQEKDLSAEIDMMVMIYKSMLSKVDLPENKLKELTEVVEANAPEYAKTQSRLNGLLTAEEHYQYKGHFRVARTANLTAAFAQDYALKKLKLSKERNKEYLKARQEFQFQEMKLNNEIISLLSKEQREKLPFFNSERILAKAINIVLPNMKTDEDFEIVKGHLEKLETVKVSSNRRDERVIRVEFKQPIPLKSTMEKLVESGVQQFNDFAPEKMKGDAFAELWVPQKKNTKPAQLENESAPIEKDQASTDDKSDD